MAIKPLNNNVLIEVVKEYAEVSRTDDNEVLKQGILRDISVSNYHLTASAALEFDHAFQITQIEVMEPLVGKMVRWEQYAEGGQTFEEDGKTYALIPWWRLISYEA